MLLAFQVVPPVGAAGTSHIGEITLSRSFATNGTEILITVTDLDLRESIARDSKTLDASGQPFSIPAGGIGQTFDLMLPLSAMADQDGDGVIGPAEFSLSIAQAEIVAVSTSTGTLTVRRAAASPSDLTYTIGSIANIVAFTDLIGSPYVLSPGLKGFSELANLPTVTPYDADGSGDVSIGDYTVDPAEASISFLNLAQGFALIERKVEIIAPLSFSIGYQTAVLFTEGLSGDVFTLPAASDFETFSIFLSNPPIADISGDGMISPLDISTAGLTGARISSVDSSSGILTLVRKGGLNADEAFSISYATALISTTSVQILGSNIENAITVVLTETSPSSSQFTQTIMSVINVSGSEVTSGTKIPVAHGDSIVVRYTDQSPRTIVDDSIKIDTIVPTISDVTPITGDYVFPTNVEISFTVSDLGSGVDINNIQIHLDNDRDEITVDDGEILTVPVQDVVEVGDSLIINTKLPDLGADGTASWFVRVFDNAGNSSRSDSDASVAGDQDGVVIIDTQSARIATAIAGERWDIESEKIETDQLGWVHLTFDEPINPAAILAERFFVDNREANTGFTPVSMPSSLFLNVPLLRGDPRELEMGTGAVNDVAGLESGLQTISVVDSLKPRLEISLSSAYVSGLLEFEVTSNENLDAAPAVSIEGRTVSVTPTEGNKKWKYQIYINQLDAARAEDRIKNIVVTGFDKSGNLGTVGQESFEADYPAKAVQFEIDTQASMPLMAPAFGAKLSGWTTLIRISFPGESNEYPGDSSFGAIITSATINGEEIGDLFESVADGVVWEYQTDTLPIGSYLVRIESADLAGNVLTPIETIFTVSSQPPEVATAVDPSEYEDEDLPEDENPAYGDPLVQSDQTDLDNDGNADPLKAGDWGGVSADDVLLGGIELDLEGTEHPVNPDAQTSVESEDEIVEDVAPSDSPADDPQPDDPPIVAPEPITASPTSTLAPGLAALFEGVMAARDSQLAADLNAGSTDKSQAQPVGEPSAVPSDEPNIEPAPESTPDFDYDPPGLTNADVEQTATAMRDASLLEDGIDVNADEEPVPASGGGGLPFANSNSPGADSALYAAGLLALVVVARRPRRKDDL